MTTATGIVIYRDSKEILFEVSQDQQLVEIEPRLSIEHGKEADSAAEVRFNGIDRSIPMGEVKRWIINHGEILVEISHHGFPERF